MEDDSPGRGGLFEPPDFEPFFVVAGISARGEHHRNGRVIGPDQLRFGKAAVRDLVEHVEPVAVEAAQHGLDFGVAETGR